MESNLLEKLIIKACTTDKSFIASISTSFKKEYFDNTTASEIYDYVLKNFNEYGTIAPTIAIIAEIDHNGKDDAKCYFDEINAIEFDVAKQYNFLFNSTNNYLKEKAIKKAILESVTIINDRPDELTNIRHFIEDALSKDLNIDLGTDYFGTLKERLIRILTTETPRIPTYFPSLDEYLAGGFPPYTFSVMLARIHGHKSSFLANMASRQVLHGKNVILASLEMSEDAFAQRFDALYSLYDINAIYRNTSIKVKLSKKLDEIKNTPGRGNLWIKAFPTGKASVDDFRRYIRELTIRGFNPDIFICDYMNLMKPAYKNKGDMYMDVKTISEELRAMSFEFKIPVVSVSQLNREGMNIPFEQVDFTYISECLHPDTLVKKWDGKVYNDVKIQELVKGDIILGSCSNVIVKKIFDKKIKKMYKIKTKSGKEIICSEDHKFPTNKGIQNIKTGLNGVGVKLKTL